MIIDNLFAVKAFITYKISSVRVSPIVTGYRPGIKFASDSSQFSGRLKFLDKSNLNPGESSEVIIQFSNFYLQSRLREGLFFTFFEGPNIIGSGYIVEI